AGSTVSVTRLCCPIWKQKLSTKPTNVPNTSDDATTGWIDTGIERNTSGNASTANPATIARPTASVLRVSCSRAAIVSMPFLRMAQEVNTNVAPTTGAGINASNRVTIGRKANTTKMADVA